MNLLRSLMIAAMTVLSIAHAYADPPRHRDDRGYERRERDGAPAYERRPIRDVVGEIERNYRGRVVDVQPPRAGEDLYRVRVLQPDGRVKTIRVPADRRRER